MRQLANAGFRVQGPGFSLRRFLPSCLRPFVPWSLPAAAIGLLLCLAVPAAAEPAWGRHCLSCHGLLQPDTLALVGEDGIVDPDESQTGAPDRGPLPVFQAYRGQVKVLQALVAELAEGDAYAVELTRLRFPGVETGGELTYTGDCTWPEWGEQANYYTDPVISYTWGEGPASFAFDISVGPDADADYYDLVFAVAGKLAASGELFYAEEHFYLQVVSDVPGDLDGDGDVDLADLAALLTVYGTCLGDPSYNEAADFDGSGCVDLPDLATLLGNYGAGT